MSTFKREKKDLNKSIWEGSFPMVVAFPDKDFERRQLNELNEEDLLLLEQACRSLRTSMYGSSNAVQKTLDDLWIKECADKPECTKYGMSKVVWCCDAWGRTGFGIYQNGKIQLQHEGWFTGGEVGEDSVRIDYWMPIPQPPVEKKRIKSE